MKNENVIVNSELRPLNMVSTRPDMENLRGYGFSVLPEHINGDRVFYGIKITDSVIEKYGIDKDELRKEKYLHEFENNYFDRTGKRYEYKFF